MKTNQVLVRSMGDFDVLQRTSDGMFNATLLLKQWNENSGQSKEIKKFFENNSTKEFIQALVKEENLNGEKSAYLKSKGKYNGGTWMHPLLFIDFAMWINPTFKVKVLRFVYDQLLKYRNDAADTYREMSYAVAKIADPRMNSVPEVIKHVARGVNFIIYGKHESSIRNKQAEEDSMKELVEFQKKITNLINEGFIKSYDQLIQYLRDQWQKKWGPAF